jgi:hypothetical protein
MATSVAPSRTLRVLMRAAPAGSLQHRTGASPLNSATNAARCGTLMASTGPTRRARGTGTPVKGSTEEMNPHPTRPSVPRALHPVFDAFTARTDAFCRRRLNEEYAELCRELAAALCRKRPSPLASGSLDGWACGVVHALGGQNGVFERSNPLHISASELAADFGVGVTSGARKAADIRRALPMHADDLRWYLPSQREQSRLPWLIRVNGFIVDAREMPREIQEAAFRRGLVPYLPESKADGVQAGEQEQQPPGDLHAGASPGPPLASAGKPARPVDARQLSLLEEG